MVYINSDERFVKTSWKGADNKIVIFSAVMFIYPASSWTEGIISSYAPLLAGRLKG